MLFGNQTTGGSNSNMHNGPCRSTAHIIFEKNWGSKKKKKNFWMQRGAFISSINVTAVEDGNRRD